MDTLSHAAWGYVVLRWRGPKAARLGAVTGAAPDLLYFVPSRLQQVWENGWQALSPVRDPRIWRADGPPLPTDLIEAYHSYYVFTHSLVILTLVFGIFAVWGRRRWLWLALPYGLHIGMDLPTHERYLTPIFYPFWDWRFSGLSWGDPRIFWPNLVVLAVAFAWIGWKYRQL